MCKLCRFPLRNKVILTGEKEPAEATGNEIVSVSNHTTAARYWSGWAQLKCQWQRVGDAWPCLCWRQFHDVPEAPQALGPLRGCTSSSAARCSLGLAEMT